MTRGRFFAAVIALLLAAACAPRVVWLDPAGAQVLAKNGGQWLRVGGADGERYQAIEQVTLSRDGKRHLYAAERDGKWFAVLDGREFGPYESVSELNFSRDG